MPDALSIDSNDSFKKDKYNSKYQNAVPNDKNKNWLAEVFRKYYF